MINNYFCRVNLRSLVNHYKFFIRTEYNSALSLKSLYPNSSLKLSTPSALPVQKPKNDTFSGYIPQDKLDVSYGLSYAPGGHIVHTKVIIKFHIETADWLNADLKKLLLEKKKSCIDKDGNFIVSSDKTRLAALNLADALQRLRTILYNIPLEESKPDSEERIRKKKEKENRERLKMKTFFRSTNL